MQEGDAGRLTLQEAPEFSAQVDAIITRHSRDVILPVLEGLFDGIAKNPRVFERAAWNVRVAKSDPLGLTVPTFRVVFQIQNEKQGDEYVLLLWIQEDDPEQDIMETLK